MASIQLSARRSPRITATTTGKRTQRRRIGVHLDTTPMVDVAFLLLTFFLLSTTLLQPQIIKMNMSPSIAEVPLPEDNLFTVYITDNDGVYYSNGQNRFQKISPRDVGQKALDLIALRRDALVTTLKATPGASYDLFIHILDELQVAEHSLMYYDPEYAQQRHRKFCVGELTQQELQQLKGL